MRSSRRSLASTFAIALGLVIALSCSTPSAAAGANVQVNVDHTVVRPDGQVIDLLVVTQVVNASTKPVAEVRYGLPRGFRDLHVLRGLNGDTYEVADGDLVLRTLLHAGETREIVFSYLLPWDGEGVEWTKSVYYPTQTLLVLVPEDALEVFSDQLQAGATLVAEDTTYLQYQAVGLVQGTECSIRVQAPEIGLGVDIVRSPGISGVLVLLLAVVAALAVLAVWRGWFLPFLRRRLLGKLVRLELAYHRGKNPGERYEGTRKKLLEQLVRVELALRKRG